VLLLIGFKWRYGSSSGLPVLAARVCLDRVCGNSVPQGCSLVGRAADALLGIHNATSRSASCQPKPSKPSSPNPLRRPSTPWRFFHLRVKTRIVPPLEMHCVRMMMGRQCRDATIEGLSLRRNSFICCEIAVGKRLSAGTANCLPPAAE